MGAAIGIGRVVTVSAVVAVDLIFYGIVDAVNFIAGRYVPVALARCGILAVRHKSVAVVADCGVLIVDRACGDDVDIGILEAVIYGGGVVNSINTLCYFTRCIGKVRFIKGRLAVLQFGALSCIKFVRCSLIKKEFYTRLCSADTRCTIGRINIFCKIDINR